MQKFVIAKFLTNPHLQTIGSVLIPRPIRFFPSVDQMFQLPDGTQLVAELSWQENKKSAPTLIVIAGLNGSTISPYIRGTSAKAYSQGFNVIRINLRNGGGSEKYSKTLSHAGRSDDLRYVIEELINSYHLQQIGLIGFSYGGNACLKTVGEWGQDAPKQLVGVAVISPLIDLAAAVNSLDHSAPKIYRWIMMKWQLSSLNTRNKHFPDQYDDQAIKKIKTLRDYDNYTAVQNGFIDADDYHAKASSLPYLSKISTPTLIIHSDDDVVIPPHSFENINNKNVQVVITRGGGHGGFISQSKGGDPDHHWAENRAIEFILNLTK